MTFNFPQVLRLGVAHVQKGESIGLNDDRSITIVYDVALGAGEEGEAWLQANRQTIKDVTVDHQTMAGVWRSTGIESAQSTSDKTQVRISQTFRKGWIQSLVTDGAIVWNEARLTNENLWHEAETQGVYPVSEENNPQQYYLVEWQGVDPTKVDEISKAIRAVGPDNVQPVINGEVLGTGFYILDVSASIDQSERGTDKSATITALIGKPRVNLQAWSNYNAPAQAKIFYLFDVPLYIAQTVINLYNKSTGRTVTASPPNERSLVNLVVRDAADTDTSGSFIASKSCAFFVKETYYYGVAAPVDAPENTMGVTYASSFRLNPEDGKFNGTLQERHRQTLHISEYRTSDANDQSTIEEIWNGVYIVGGVPNSAVLSITAGNIVTTLTTITLPEDGTDLNGNIRQISKSPNDDCTENITKVVRSGIAMDSGWIGYVDGNGTSYYRNFRNQTAPLVDGYTDATNNGLSFSENSFGLFDGSGTRVFKDDAGSGSIFRSTRTDIRPPEPKSRRIEKVSPGAGKYYQNQTGTNTRTHKSVITNNYGDADLAFSSFFKEAGLGVLVKGPTLKADVTFDGYKFYRVDATYLLEGAWA